MRKTSALVEAGLLAAIAALFTIVGNYLPILYALSDFLWPLALILCGRRHGLKWSILCLVVSSIIVALLLNPLEAAFKLVTVSFAGITMGECMRRQLTPFKTIFFGSIATLLSVVSGLALSFVVMQVNPLQEISTLLQQSVDIMKEIAVQFKLPAEFTAQVETFPKMAMLFLPASLVIGAPFSTAIDYFLARKVLGRLGDYYPPCPAFSTWQLPKYVLVPYGLALAILYFTKDNPEALLYKVAVNVFYFMCVSLLMEALALIRWYVITKEKPKAWFYCGVFLALTNPLFSQLAIILGAYDLIFNFRARLSARG